MLVVRHQAQFGDKPHRLDPNLDEVMDVESMRALILQVGGNPITGGKFARFNGKSEAQRQLEHLVYRPCIGTLIALRLPNLVARRPFRPSLCLFGGSMPDNTRAHPGFPFVCVCVCVCRFWTAAARCYKTIRSLGRPRRSRCLCGTGYRDERLEVLEIHDPANPASVYSSDAKPCYGCAHGCGALIV